MAIPTILFQTAAAIPSDLILAPSSNLFSHMEPFPITAASAFITSASYALIAIDIRGFGGSTHPAGVQSSSTLVDITGDSACVLKHVGIQSVISGLMMGSIKTSRFNPGLVDRAKYILKEHLEIDLNRMVATVVSCGRYTIKHWIQSTPKLGFWSKVLVHQDRVFDRTCNDHAAHELVLLFDAAFKASHQYSPMYTVAMWPTLQLMFHSGRSQDPRRRYSSCGVPCVAAAAGCPKPLSDLPRRESLSDKLWE